MDRRAILMDDDDSELKIGDVLDEKYLVVRRLGSGGMGVVHAAKRTALGDIVAIKSLLRTQNTATNRARFVREAQAAARIRHPNVVQVFDFAAAPQRPPYLVMEFLDGPTLSDVLADTPRLPLPRALSVFARVCAAVEAGHRRGVVHRDLKPGNVMVARSDDGRESVKVLDFGLARIIVPGAGADLTLPGALLGTVSYMAPEQILGLDATASSDIYALGVILYQLATGRLPFVADNHMALMLKISAGQYDDPTKLVPDLAPEITAAIAAALATDPAVRPRSAEDLATRVGAPIGHAWIGGESMPINVAPRPDEDATLAVPPAASKPPTITATPSLASDRRSERSLIGRHDALEQLQQALAEVGGGKARTIIVLGEAGLGKTTLVDTVCHQLQGRGANVLRGQFFAYEGDRPPPYEIFERMLATTVVDEDVAQRSVAGEEKDKWQRFAGLAQRFAAAGRGRMLVVRIEDLQWSGPSELEFLAYLQHAMADQPLAIVATTRAGNPDVERWLQGLTERRASIMIRLEAWTDDDVRAWMLASFPGLRIRPGDLREIARVTSGNPYAVSELARLLVARKLLERTTGGWACEPLHDVPMPDSMHAVLEAQYEREDPAVLEILEVACVIGEHFRFETLCLAAQIDETRVETALEQAARARLVTDRGVAPGSDHRFCSPSLRQVLYERMSARRRMRLHARVVDALTKLYGEGNARLAHLFAYHFHAIERWPQALATALVGAERALAGHDVDLLGACLRRADGALAELEAAGEVVSARDHVRRDRAAGELANVLGRFVDADRALRRAIDGATAIGESSLALDATVALVHSLMGRGELAAGGDMAERAALLARALGDPLRAAQAGILLASCVGPLGQVERARAAVDPIVADATLPPVLHALALREVAWLAAKGGDFAASEIAARKSMEAARLARDAHAEYRATSALALAYAECGDYVSAIPQLEQALRLARALSQRRREGIELANLAECRQLSGDAAGALVDASAALDIFVEIGDRACEGDCRVNLGRMLVALDRRAEAIAMLEEGREQCAASGRVEYEAIALCELGDLRVVEGSALQAKVLFERARAAFERIGSGLLWRADLGLAKVAAATGADGDASDAATRALALVDKQLAALPTRVQAELLGRARAELAPFVARRAAVTNTRPLRAELAAQHARLTRIAGELVVTLDVATLSSQPQLATAALKRLVDGLRQHATTESDALYPGLLGHTDPKIRERAARLYADGLGLYDEVFALGDRWASGTTIAAEPGRFATEAGGVLRKLAARMHREDEQLHPLVDEL